MLNEELRGFVLYLDDLLKQLDGGILGSLDRYSLVNDCDEGVSLAKPFLAFNVPKPPPGETRDYIIEINESGMEDAERFGMACLRIKSLAKKGKLPPPEVVNTIDKLAGRVKKWNATQLAERAAGKGATAPTQRKLGVCERHAAILQFLGSRGRPSPAREIVTGVAYLLQETNVGCGVSTIKADLQKLKSKGRIGHNSSGQRRGYYIPCNLVIFPLENN